MNQTNDETRPDGARDEHEHENGQQPVLDAEPTETLDAADADEQYDEDEDAVYDEPRRGVPPLLAAIAGLVLLAGGAVGGYLFAQRDATPADPVVATVNGNTIRRSEYDRAVAKGNGARVLDQLVVERLIDGEAQKRGLTVTDEQLAKLRDEERSRFPSEEAFQAALSQAGFDEAELNRQLRLNDLLRQMVADKVQVTDQEVEARFASAQGQGQPPEGSADKLKAQLKADMIDEKTNQAVAPLIQELKAAATIEMRLPGQGGV